MCMTGLSKPLSTRHTTTGPHTGANPTPYRTYHPQTQSLWGSRGWMRPSTFAVILLALESATQPYDPQRRLPFLSLSSWHDTMDILKQEQLTRFSPFAPACSLSPYHFSPLNQVGHTRHFSFSLHAFSMKWSNRLSPFHFVLFCSVSFTHIFFGLRCLLLLSCLSLHFQMNFM